MEALHGKWALVTGASSGFGEEFARQYAAQGRPLVLVARRLEKLETLATELRETYRVDVIVEQVDLSNVAAVIQLHQRLRERGIGIDILINNAGHGLQGTFVDGTLDAALAMLQLDVVSLTAVTHVFAQDMRTRGRGKILLVASMLAYQGVEKFAVYAAAKAYVLRLGEALHRELKRDGITVTVLCPGMSDTGFATAAQQKITPALKLLMMQPAPVVRAGIRALWEPQMIVAMRTPRRSRRDDRGTPMTTTMSELKRKSASRSDRERASQRVDFNLSSKSSLPGPSGDIECGIVRPPKQ
jgi:short-subunit dehydrogenase